MLDWIRKPGADPEHPMRNPASASVLLAELRERDPVAALDELRGWLGTLGDMPDLDERVRSEVLGLVQEAGAAHVAKLLRQHLADAPDSPVVRESKWKAMFAYATRLAEVLGASAERLLAIAKTDASAGGAAAAGAVRALRACRLLAKTCLTRYADAPASLWRRAYAVHAAAEATDCAGTAVHPHRSQRISTTVAEELLRLLMLHVIAPETLAPEQIEIAERAVEQLGSEFTLRPPGLADSAFWFDGAGDRAPQRATAAPRAPAARFFGPGVGLDALARLHRQMESAGGAEASPFGKDVPPHAQIAAVEHLLLHWGPAPPRAAPVHQPAKGEVLIVHGYARVCRHLGGGDAARGAPQGLALASDDDIAPDPPETWTIRNAGGSEIGAELAQPGVGWARSGTLVALSIVGRNEWWLGAIRRTHAGPAGGTHVDIALLSRSPIVASLRPQPDAASGAADWNAAAGTFAFVNVDAILLPDASQATGTPNLLLPPEGWKPGRTYERLTKEGPRSVRLVKALQRGGDFVRAAYEEPAAVHG